MKSLAGSVYKTKDGRWFARVQYQDRSGRRRQKRRICATRKLAAGEVRELLREIERELSDRKTYRELDRFYRREYVHAAKFVGGKKISGFRQSVDTVSMYLDRGLAFFGDRPIDEITFADLRAYKAAVERSATMHGRPRSVSDVNHHLKRVRRLFAVAVEQGWLSVNPFVRGGSLIIESHETERTRILSPAEESRLLAACSRWRRHLRPIIIIAIETGLRRGEMRSLRWSGVNLDGRFVKVESANSKTLRSRLVPLSERAAETLAQLRHNSTGRESALVFGSSDFKKAFIGAVAEAGLSDVHFHDLRHTAITRWLEKGVSPALAMKASGHSQSKTFLRYVNQNETSVAEFARVISRAA